VEPGSDEKVVLVYEEPPFPVVERASSAGGH
jgi:hypothetical protein